MKESLGKQGRVNGDMDSSEPDAVVGGWAVLDTPCPGLTPVKTLNVGPGRLMKRWEGQ